MEAHTTYFNNILVSPKKFAIYTWWVADEQAKKPILAVAGRMVEYAE
jgi:hypothetical protein